MDNVDVNQNTECYRGFRMVDRFKARKAYKPSACTRQMIIKMTDLQAFKHNSGKQNLIGEFRPILENLKTQTDVARLAPWKER